MDPDANLKEQLELVKKMKERQSEFNEEEEEWTAADVSDWRREQVDDGERLAELVEALNEWILKGGFLPKAWHDVQVAKVMT
jgi:broad specificity phosphatase PhoE